MNLPRFALSHQAIVLTFVVLLLAVGLFNFTTMSRREDPEITIRDALVITVWPGASATRVEEAASSRMITACRRGERMTWARTVAGTTRSGPAGSRPACFATVRSRGSEPAPAIALAFKSLTK